MRIAPLLLALVAWNISGAQDLVITNARIIDGTGQVLERASLFVRSGRIESLGEDTPGNMDATVIDAQGMTVMPGMINTHWHLLVGSPATNDEEAEDFVTDVVAGELQALAQRGVTTIMSFGDHFPQIISVRQRVRSGELPGPRLLVVGPVLTSPNDWPTQICSDNVFCRDNLNVELTSPDEARQKVRELAEAKVDAIKLVYDDSIAPGVRIDDEIVEAIANESRANGLTLHVHISTNDETALQVAKLGAGALVHPVSLRTPENEETARILRELRIPISTTISGMTRDWFEMTGREYPDDVALQFERRLEDIKHLWDEGVVVAFGTDTVAGPGYLADEQFLAEARGLNEVLSNQDVLATLTRNAAEYLGLGDDLGTLERGKIADIIFIDGDPLTDIADLMKVQVVIQGGQVTVDRR